MERGTNVVKGQQVCSYTPKVCILITEQETLRNLRRLSEDLTLIVIIIL